MAFKRLLIEFGQGVDMHGGDQNNAVLKAAKIHADIYVPHPEQADAAVVTDYLRDWTVDAEVHQGGANPRGIALFEKPETEITIAIVVLTVYVDA